MKVQAILNNYRRSSKKIVEIARVLRGMDCAVALAQLEQNYKKDAPVLSKLISSAMANAQNNFGLDKNNLFVCDIVIGAGPTMKRWRARAYGRAASILKRTSQVTVVLDERKPTKVVKAPKKVEEIKDITATEAQSSKEEGAKKQEEKKFADNNKGKVNQKGFGKKVFRRKSA